MASGIMRKAMVFLGLDDEEMDDYDLYDEGSVAPQPPRRYAPEPIEPVVNDRPVVGIRPMPRESIPDPSGSVRLTPGPPAVRQIITPVANVRASIVVPDRFSDAQEIGERFLKRSPVVVNLKGADSQLTRRIIDFCSGVTYALSGTMEKSADQVFLLTPENVELPADERRRLQEKGLYHS
jgi:cell division inhibitor SepF